MRHTLFQVDCVGMSDIGLVREGNEDVWVALPEEGLFLLADGMGGHAAGEVAAQEAVDYLSKLVKEWNPSSESALEEGVDFFQKALRKVNRYIYRKGQSDSSLAGMGTTLCALYFLHTHGILAHVGDSRIYRKRSDQLEQLSEDHSLVSELMAMGAMKPEDARTFPYQHILTRAIGTQLTVEPSVNCVLIEPHDLFMLCSDGLTNFVSDQEIFQALSRGDTSLEERGKELVDLAITHGGGDNVTLVLASIGDDLSR